jgi:hypothetical protein
VSSSPLVAAGDGKVDVALLRADRKPVDARREVVAAALVRVAGRPPVVEPAERPPEPVVEGGVVEAQADLPGDEERAQDALELRQVRGVADHLVGERLLLPADRELAERRADRDLDPEVRDPPGVRRLRIEALVLEGEEVLPGILELDRAAKDHPRRPQVPVVVLAAHLVDARRVLLEVRVVADEDEPEVEREGLRGEARELVELLRDVGNGVPVSCAPSGGASPGGSWPSETAAAGAGVGVGGGSCAGAAERTNTKTRTPKTATCITARPTRPTTEGPIRSGSW